MLLVGSLAALALCIALVAVNPGTAVEDEPGISVIRGERLPLKSRSMRAAVLGARFGGE